METGARDQVDITSHAFTSTMRRMTALSRRAGGPQPMGRGNGRYIFVAQGAVR